MLQRLQPFGSRIPDTWSIKLTFSLRTIFGFTKTEKRTIKFLTQLSYYCFEQRYYFCQKMLIFCKKGDISKIKGVMVLKGVFSETKYVCVQRYQVSNVILTSFRQGIVLPLPLTARRTLKKPTLIRAKRLICLG